MGLKEEMLSTYNVLGVKRVEYWDSRYYRVQLKPKKSKELIEKHFPSVTEILGAYPKDFLERWRGDVGNERADQIVREAFGLGSFVHFGAETIAKGGTVIYSPIENPLYTPDELAKVIENCKKGYCICRTQREFIQLWRIKQFFDAVNPAYIETEQMVFSVEHEYAGTLDLILYIEEGDYMIAGSQPLHLKAGYYICDFKTGKGVDYSYKMQLAAYTAAVIEGCPTYSDKIAGGLLLHSNNEQIKNGIEGFKATLLSMDEFPEVFQHFLKVQAVYKIQKPVPSPKVFAMPSLLSYSYIKPAKSKPKSKK